MYYYFGEIESSKGFSHSSKNNKIDNLINRIINFKNGVQFKENLRIIKFDFTTKK